MIVPGRLNFYGSTLDQIRIFAGHQLRPVYFSEADIAAHRERVYRP